MAATYTAGASDKDWVRFHVGDTDVAVAAFTDEEIVAVLAEETATGKALKYYAAATCLQVLLTEWKSTGKGIHSRKAARADVIYGTGAGTNADVAIQDHIKALRRRGAALISAEPFVLRMV